VRSASFLTVTVRSRSALIIAIAAALLFGVVSSVRLTGQGLYYDELHQATAAFAYVGIPPQMFSALAVETIPVMNMPYSGAMKTAVYGLYLRYLRTHFSVISWRLLGILFVSAGILVFGFVACRRLPLMWSVAFLFLCLTDTTAVLATRHDWGPAALSLSLRLLFMAVWIHGATQDRAPARNFFLLGCLVGLAVFEKLIALVLLAPLILIVVCSVNRRSLRHYLACMAGVAVGAVPLILANLYSWVSSGNLISFSSRLNPYVISLRGFLNYLPQYIALGSGKALKWFILGVSADDRMEMIIVALLLLFAAIGSARFCRQSRFWRMSGTMLICYGAVGAVLYLLPSWIHHWLVGTPLQYAAIAFALVGLQDLDTAGALRWQLFRTVFLAAMALLVVSRLVSIVSLEKSFLNGDASMSWDPSLTEIGYFASKESGQAVFIAADWGIGAQILSLSDGQPDLLSELYSNYRGPEDLKSVVKQSGKRIAYVVVKKPNSPVNPRNTARIMRDIETSPDWKQLPVEAEVAKLRAVGVEKFLYVGD
jgi:hypothetical protein